MRSILIAILVALLAASLASALPSVANQGIVSNAQGTGSVTQNSTNQAAISGDNALYGGSIIQGAVSSGPVDQTAANKANVIGDNAYSAQGIAQAGQGGTVTQAGTNDLALQGDNAVAGQSLAQAGVATGAVVQTGGNTAYAEGDNAMIGQSAYTAGFGSSVTQGVSNSANVVGSNPITSQFVAASATASGAVNQDLNNSLWVNIGSIGGAAAQSISSGAVGGTVKQITNNLIGEF